jgi:hypothetical protein
MSNRKPVLAVGVPLDAAIATHQKALHDGDAELGHILLRSVVMAHTASGGDLRQMLDYLTALPVGAWPDQGDGAAIVRDETLAGIRRSIAWQQAN